MSKNKKVPKNIPYKRILYRFRQDLRVDDNSGLTQARNDCVEIVPVFVYDSFVLDQFPDDDPRLGFQHQALCKLQDELRGLGADLHTYKGSTKTLIPALLKAYDCDALYFNSAYGTHVEGRDHAVTEAASTMGVHTQQFADYLVVEPKHIEVRKVYSAFYRLRQMYPKSVTHYSISKREQAEIKPTLPEQFLELNESSLQTIGGSPLPMRDVHELNTHLERAFNADYDTERNFPGTEGTSKLSPFLNFGVVSPREVLRRQLRWHVDNGGVGVQYSNESDTVIMDHNNKRFKSTFVQELAWRDFWNFSMHYFPETAHTAFNKKYTNIEWVNHDARRKARKTGTTGYPIVDAAMRQLHIEKWMHGRTRMIVASFLTKDLLIDRKRGEEHFRDHLLDYDSNINIGNRQRSASIGIDPKPLRIFNPILQSKKYDPDASYILKWIPELKGQDIKAIHDPIKYDLDYIEPVVDHYVTSKIAKKMYYGDAFKKEIAELF